MPAVPAGRRASPRASLPPGSLPPPPPGAGRRRGSGRPSRCGCRRRCSARIEPVAGSGRPDPAAGRAAAPRRRVEVAGFVGRSPSTISAAQPAPGVLHKYAGPRPPRRHRRLSRSTAATASGATSPTARHEPRRGSVSPRRSTYLRSGDLAARGDPQRGRPAVAGPTPDSRRSSESVSRPLGIIERLRVHTRYPDRRPRSRVDDGARLLARGHEAVAAGRGHPRQPSAGSSTRRGCGSPVAILAEAGIPLLNQAVLLRGVNDSADALSRR